ncbi:MAG: hypothetical protein OHK0039_23390 [Bacteroidia bacterium]
MDNNGDQPLIVTIDELTYRMQPHAYQRIELEAGTHVLTIKEEAGRVIDTDTFQVIEGGLLNLAKTNYLIWVDLYGDPELRKTILQEDWIEIGNQSYFGQFEPVDVGAYYVESKWDYGLDEDFPEDLLGWEISREKWIIKRKLFREDELVNAYNSLVKQP